HRILRRGGAEPAAAGGSPPPARLPAGRPRSAGAAVPFLVALAACATTRPWAGAPASSGRALAAVEDASSAALQADEPRALEILRAVPPAEFQGSEAAFRTCSPAIPDTILRGPGRASRWTRSGGSGMRGAPSIATEPDGRGERHRNSGMV